MITFYVITKAPVDWPDVPYVVRPQYAVPGRIWSGPIACLCPTLAWARMGPSQLGALPFARDPDDDPVIVESWML
jgi:hypothetical protein